jgi:hypothetical protein
MLTQPTAQHLRAMMVLNSHSAWDGVGKFLDDELAEIHRRLTYTADEVQVRQLQGRAAAIRELRDAVTGSRQSLEKLGLQAPL